MFPPPPPLLLGQYVYFRKFGCYNRKNQKLPISFLGVILSTCNLCAFWNIYVLSEVVGLQLDINYVAMGKVLFNFLELHVFCDLHLCELVSFLLALMCVCFEAFCILA